MTVFSTDIALPSFAPVRRLDLRLYLTVWAERRSLARLGPRQLADLGLTKAQARAESRRPIWDMPTNRASRRQS